MLKFEKNIDITGNWQDSGGFKPYIQTKEPWLVGEETRTFYQTLNLPKGCYSVKLDYDILLDKAPGYSIDQAFDCFTGLNLNGLTQDLHFINHASNSTLFTASGDIQLDDDVNILQLQLQLRNTRVMKTRLTYVDKLPSKTGFYAVGPGETEGREEKGETLLVRGIPFVVRKLESRFFWPSFQSMETEIDEGSLLSWEMGRMRLPCFDASVRTAHFLGMIHLADIANGSWYSPKGDHGYSHFVGDQAGQIVIRWTDGETSVIPLIFGFNLWYSTPWDFVWHYDRNPYTLGGESDNFDKVMFGGDDQYRMILEEGVALVDGIRQMGRNSSNARFIFSVDLHGRKVAAIEVQGNPEMYGHPLISAVTLETDGDCAGLRIMPNISSKNSELHILSLEYIDRQAYLPGIENIKHTFYTYVDELPKLKEPLKPGGYFGPEYDFQGTQEAVYASTFLYHNGPECAAHIADSGTACSSSTASCALHHYTFGMGVWIERPPLYDGISDWFSKYKSRIPGQMPGLGEAWTRGIGELMRETMAFGYDKFIDSYVDWLDLKLMTESNPPHWNRIAGIQENKRRMVGNVEELGNRENDGHGICMWARYMMWHWMARPQKWNERRWHETRAAVEWIQWQLDHDILYPGVRKDVMFTDSECAHDNYDIYSSYNCLHGIKLSIRMAKQLGKTAEISSWTELYNRLRRGILEHLTVKTEFGTIWYTEAECDWQDHAHKLVHLQLASEGDTFTPLQDYVQGDELDQRFLLISQNSYRFLMQEKNYNCLRMYGYGQGMMTQAALLLDEMTDAAEFINMLLRHCYLPKFSGWVCPEGIILHKSGQYYLPVNAYMGQDSHLADSTKAIRLMLGMDDNDADHLYIVPRYPKEWIKMSIARFPVITGELRQHVNYTYIRNDSSQTFMFQFEKPVDQFSVRLGPIPDSHQIKEVTYQQNPISFELLESGDSRWVWVRNLTGQAGKVMVDFSS